MDVILTELLVRLETARMCN